MRAEYLEGIAFSKAGSAFDRFFRASGRQPRGVVPPEAPHSMSDRRRCSSARRRERRLAQAGESARRTNLLSDEPSAEPRLFQRDVSENGSTKPYRDFPEGVLRTAKLHGWGANGALQIPDKGEKDVESAYILDIVWPSTLPSPAL
jgi:hypothetical protein